MHLLTRIFILLATSTVVFCIGQLDTVFEWKYVDYLWPSKLERQRAIDSGDYKPSAPIPIDVDVSRDGRVFVTLANFDGTPARLGVVTNHDDSKGPLIEPYPGWEWFKIDNCDSIHNVLRVAIDGCNRLWTVDTGYRPKNFPLCKPKLMAFDLATNKLIRKEVLPDNIVRTNRGGNVTPDDQSSAVTFLVNLVVETQGSRCENTTVYMADWSTHSLIIWNGESFHRLEGAAFRPQQKAANLSVSSDSLWFLQGTQGIGLSPKVFPNEPHFLYFRPLASYSIYSIDTRVLKDRRRGDKVKISGVEDILSSQSVVHVFSSDGTMFLGLTKEIAIACWNRYKKLTRSNIEIVAQDNERLQYASGMKVITHPVTGEEQLWVMTDRWPTYANGRINLSDVNYRVLKGSVKKLIAGTNCELPLKKLSSSDIQVPRRTQ